MKDKLKLLVNWRPATEGTKSGVPYYLEGLFGALASRPGIVVHRVNVRPRNSIHGSFGNYGLIARKFLESICVPLRARLGGYAAYIETEYFFRPRVPFGPVAFVDIVYDLGLARFDDIAAPELTAYFRTALPRTLAMADLAVTCSDSTAQELRKYLAAHGIAIPVVAVPAASTLPPGGGEVTHFREIHGDYLLCLGTVEPRKNPLLLLEGYIEYRKRTLSQAIKLIYVGKLGWMYDQFLKRARSCEFSNDVVIAGYASDAEKAGYLRGARALVLLSKYEGFGMPPLEALNAGVPILLSDIPVFRELYDGAAVFADISTGPLPVAEGIAEVLSLDARDYSTTIGRFTWEGAAAILDTALRRVIVQWNRKGI